MVLTGEGAKIKVKGEAEEARRCLQEQGGRGCVQEGERAGLRRALATAEGAAGGSGGRREECGKTNADCTQTDGEEGRRWIVDPRREEARALGSFFPVGEYGWGC